MKEIKQRKERRFLKTLGRVGEILVEQVLLKIGSNLIKKIGGKKTLPSILFLFASLNLFAQYPATGNKQRLGYQTSGDGLVYRGRSSDTVAIKSSGLNNAYFILDTVNNIQYNYIKTKGGWVFSNGDTIIINNNFTQPVDSLFFNVNVPTNNVDTAKMRWDSDLATVVLGLNDNVPNELGFKNFWLVKNQTGSTITKGSLVYANGTVGASGRITVAKFIANGSIDAKYLLGITAHDLSNGEDGYVISFGKIRQVNTDTFATGAILYPSPTVAGVWTDVEPVAPNIDMPIGFCINSHVNNGTIAIRVASGYKLSELHDVSITSPVENSSLYYKGGLWRDTTAALLTSDTASMLTNYLRTGVAASTYLPLTGGTLSGTLGVTGATTLTGGLTGTTGVFSGNVAIGTTTAYKPLEVISNANDFVSVGVRELGQFQYSGIHFGYRQPNTDYRSSAIVFQRNEIPPFIDATGKIHLLNVSYGNSGRSADLRDAKLTISNIGGYVGINDTSPEYQLDVNGTLGVTGATTLNSGLKIIGTTDIFNGQPFSTLQLIPALTIGSTDNTVQTINTTGLSFKIGLTERMKLNSSGLLTVTDAATFNSGAVFNENSNDSDFRVESDGNANMVFVDASTDRVGIGYASPTKTLDVNGEVRINTVTATPTSLLGKDGSNVVGEVTTVAQTGLMTRGETTATTGSPSAIFTVTHGLGFNPSSVIVTSAGIGGGNKILFEVYTKNSTTFSVQAWNLDGTEAASKEVKIYWLAIK